MKTEIALLLGCLVFAAGCQPEPAEKVEKEEIVGKLWTEADRRYILEALDRTTEELLRETERLGQDQWTFRESEFRWSIAEIVEHLTLQNELHYREITALANVPEMPQYLPFTKGQDGIIEAYATAPEKAQAKWYLQPIGRFQSRRQAMDGFLRARDGLRDFVEATDVDLRRHFTFRNGAGAKPLDELEAGDVRDLHQLLLLGIAHTDRHLRQIRELKKHPQYPRDI